MKDGQLSKLLIRSFTNKRLTDKDGEYPEFEIPVNPENFSQTYKVEYDKEKGQGSQGTDPKFKSTAPEELKIEFFLDGTKTIEGYSKKLIDKPVSKQVKDFMNTVYLMKGDIHKPKFLKLIWGEHLVFDCILTSLDINYTLFHPNGEPLRAKLSASFLNYIEQEKRVKREDKQSPDLTHLRRVKEGDTLPLMAHRIYGTTKYYMQVARANGMTSFRQLPPGSEIVFPPLEKTTTTA
ncbi:MAG: LysM peptidoglycan-binding domain-containing protein [Bacteroidota bacterium]